MTAHLFQIITQRCLHLLNIAIRSSIMLKETFIYENELIICERASHYSILELNLLQTLQIDFSHLFADSYWVLYLVPLVCYRCLKR